MTTIWKFRLLASGIEIAVPVGAKLLSMQAQLGTPCLWFLVDTKADLENRVFRIFATGEEIKNPEKHVYIDTYQVCGGEYIFHVFEYINK